MAPKGSPPEPAGTVNHATRETCKIGKHEGFEKDQNQRMGENKSKEHSEKDQERIENGAKDEKVVEKEENKTNIGQQATPSMSSKDETMSGESMNKLCNILKNGMCEQHGIMSTMVQITSKVWKDRGGGQGYGYVSKKVNKPVCRAKNEPPLVSNISTDERSMSHVAASGIKVKVTLDGRLASGDNPAILEHVNKKTGH